jgi:hypothetical protein
MAQATHPGRPKASRGSAAPTAGRATPRLPLGSALGVEVAVGLLAADAKVAPQGAANPSDRLGLELPRREHALDPRRLAHTMLDRASQPERAHRDPHNSHPLSTRTDDRSGHPKPAHRTPQEAEADAPRCPAPPDSSQGGERPRLRRRGRAPAPVRGPAVVAAAGQIPRRLGGRLKDAARSFGPAYGRP